MTLINTSLSEEIDLGKALQSVNTAAGAAQIFEEIKSIATGFLKRTETVEKQLNTIVATVYVNLKKRAEDGDQWSADMVKWMDVEIAVLKDFRDRYYVEFAAAPVSEPEADAT